MTPQARYWSSGTFDAWCAKQEAKIRLDLQRAGRRYVDRIAKRTEGGPEFVVESRGTTHGGGPSRYGDLADA